uniref:Uncharacterized protein n=1 Tax=Timema shepardi TaxID=629360 RepID=A0A7R9B7S1_TIMSH|nr:unnamed protein product [Timema shepardi]
MNHGASSSGIPPLNGLDGVDQWDAIVYNLPSQRTEVLININEKKRTAAIRFQNSKLIIGFTGDGNPFPLMPSFIAQLCQLVRVRETEAREHIARRNNMQH